MKILIIGPSEFKSKGGMATVIIGMRKSKILNDKFDIDIHSSYIDGNILIRLLYSIYGYLKFLTIYKKYDLFHIHVASYGSTFRKIFYLNKIKKVGKKAIVHIHGAKYLIFYDSLNRKKKNKVVNFLKNANRVIALSDDWKYKFENTFGITNCKSLNNGINSEELANGKCDINAHKNEFVLLGRLGERKGAYDLINAVEMSVKQNPNIMLYMAGDGEIENVKSIIAEKKLDENIKVLGWINNNQKIDLLKKCSTLVLPSYNEGLPMSVLEGMAAGKAIISTTVGAIPEVISEENGILINPGDINALAKALVKCSTDINMLNEMSKNNIAKIKKNYSTKIMHENLARCYESTMQ